MNSRTGTCSPGNPGCPRRLSQRCRASAGMRGRATRGPRIASWGATCGPASVRSVPRAASSGRGEGSGPPYRIQAGGGAGPGLHPGPALHAPQAHLTLAGQQAPGHGRPAHGGVRATRGPAPGRGRACSARANRSSARGTGPSSSAPPCSNGMGRVSGVRTASQHGQAGLCRGPA